MKRSMMHVYTKNSGEAFEFYRRAFDAAVVCCHPREDGTIDHAELDVYGQIVALRELDGDSVSTGNTMQFCLELGEGDVVRKIYGALREGALKDAPPDSCEWSPLVFGVIDKYGVNWCVYV